MQVTWEVFLTPKVCTFACLSEIFCFIKKILQKRLFNKIKGSYSIKIEQLKYSIV